MPKQANHLRLKKPCANCPFRKEGAIELALGRLEGIINDIVENDMTTFHCHKTVHSKSGGEWDEEGNYAPSGQESMCAGAAAYLMKIGRPTVAMRIAFAFGDAKVSDWDEAQELVVEPLVQGDRHCCKVSDEAAFCLIQRPYISKTLLTRRISPRGSP
ncbi:hypothetical protein C1Y74_004939 [Escherichia coli]|nr:hypothetical protein [Escherichia coli]EFB7298607.1 hypothetical protein [Escherichia coli]